MKNFIVRTITGIIFVAAIVTCFLRPEAMILLFAIVTGLTIWEFAGLVNAREGVAINRMICTVAGVYFFLAMAGYNSGMTPSTVFVPYLLSVVYLLVAELYLKQKDPVNNWAYTMMSQMYVALPFSLIPVLGFMSDPAHPMEIQYRWIFPLAVFIFLWTSDTGAYCFGSLFGRHRLFERISPKKSWEGSVGGACVSMAAACAVAHFDSSLTLPQWLGFALVVVVFGTWGDLVESLLKRQLGIKDSGNILPGHGGMLDRFDSSLLAIPAVVVYLYTLTLL